MVNSTTNASANNIGVSKVMDPRNMVATQLKTFTPVGTAINMVANIKNTSPTSGIPTVNMWCAHTINESSAIEATAYTIEGYPNNRFRAKVGMISLTIPNAGKIMMYTSGWPKNQNTCWNRTGSPPPAALKKLVPKWISISIIVTTPARTGMTAINKKAVINQVQTNSGIFISVMPGARRFRMVAMMLIAPIMDETPMMCTPKMKNVVDGGP